MLARQPFCAAVGLTLCISALHPCSSESRLSAGSRHSDVFSAQRLDDEVPRLMSDRHIPGMSVCVIRNGAVKWHRGLGVRDVNTGQRVDGETVFPAASLTKPVFAYAVLKMCDEGLLDLDTPLVEYAPAAYIEENFLRHSMDEPGFKREWFEAITARMALSHSSGLQHFGLKHPVELLFEPGTKFHYSSNGIEYLRYVVEHIKGARVDDIVDEYVFAPLSMAHSSLGWREEHEANSAADHDQYGRTAGSAGKFIEPTAQAGLYTNAVDYAEFLLAVLNGTGLKTETHTQMMRPHIQCHPDVPNVYWGLGFGIETHGGDKGIWHFGDGGSFTSYCYMNLNSRSGFAYFVNGHYGLTVLDEIFALTCPGEHPALNLIIGDWSFRDDYLSPAMTFKCKYFNGDVDDALTYYREVSSDDERGKQFIDEDRLLRWACGFVKSDRIEDAMRILQLALDAYYADRSTSCNELLREYADHAAPDSAIEYLKAAGSIVNDTKLSWSADLYVAQSRPINPGRRTLESLVGSYPPFDIELEGAGLSFGRKGVGKAEVVWLDEDTFILEEAEGVWLDLVKENDSVVALRISAGRSRPTVYLREK